MWSKIRSLSFKLTFIYTVSLVAVILSLVSYIEYNNHQQEVWQALLGSEVGLGYINGAQPQVADFQAVNNNPEYAITGDDISNRLARFNRFFDTSIPGGVMTSPVLQGPITVENKEYYTITYHITEQASNHSYEVGPIMLSENSFPKTIASFHGLSTDRISDLYYLPIPGYDNMLYVISMNNFSYPVLSIRQLFSRDISQVIPWIIVLSLGFGFLISWITTRPLKRITLATERLGQSDLTQRVTAKSGDEIGRLARTFNAMADRLQEAFTSQRRFVSDAAHELRTPLASMKTSVTRALSADRDTSDYQKLLGFLSGRIDHMEAMVNDLLFLSRIDEGRHEFDKVMLDLSGILTESGDSFRYLFEDKGITFSIEIESGLFVSGDRKLVLRVISNILDNAAKNTSSGGRVYMKARRQGGQIVTEVNNTGPVIPPEHLDHIFDRFYKVPGHERENNGHGLGLAICKSIVEASCGHLSVYSDTAEGTTFTIKLPVFKDLPKT